MKPILSLIVITSVVLSLGMVVARRIGAAQPPSSFAKMFTNPNGTPCKMPCMFGIRIGETTKEQAIERLRLHPLTQHLSHFPLGDGISASSEPMYVFVQFSKEREINAIELYYGQRGLADLADIVAYYGAPDFIVLDKCAALTDIYYLKQNIRITLARFIAYEQSICVEKRLGLETSLVRIIMLPEIPFDSAIRYSVRWQGFASISRYLKLTPPP